MSSLKNDTRPDRGKIDVHDAREVPMLGQAP
jgi:hypothetical protein